MPLDSAKAAATVAAINDVFAAVGHAEGTCLPRGKRNTEPAAWEYHIATHLTRLAEARKRKAQAEAIRLGLIFDPEKSPLLPNTSEVVYAGDLVEISVTVTSPSTRLDAESLIADLEKSGVARALLNRLVAKHTWLSRPPHKFTSSLVTS